jgi:hypothetical protein
MCNVVGDSYGDGIIFPCVECWPRELPVDSEKGFCCTELCSVLQDHLHAQEFDKIDRSHPFFIFDVKIFYSSISFK